MNKSRFYKKFDELPREDRLEMVHTPLEPTSLLVIFKQLQQVQAQQRYFEEREQELLRLADIGFKQLEEGKNQDGLQR